jgi:hypothetical protein
VWCRGLVAALVAAGFALGAETANGARGAVDPVGTWSCVVWGHPDFGDERVLFDFTPQGVARLARIETAAVPAWSGLTPWIPEPGGSTRQTCAARVWAAPGGR